MGNGTNAPKVSGINIAKKSSGFTLQVSYNDVGYSLDKAWFNLTSNNQKTITYKDHPGTTINTNDLNFPNEFTWDIDTSKEYHLHLRFKKSEEVRIQHFKITSEHIDISS